jgi:hypothetical protein
MRTVLLLRDGELDPRTRSLETVWRDPATPTYAQKADAVVKLHAAGILPTEQAREDLGYSAAQRARMREMDDDALTRMTAMDLHQMSTAFTGAEPKGPASGPAEPVPAGG